MRLPKSEGPYAAAWRHYRRCVTRDVVMWIAVFPVTILAFGLVPNTPVIAMIAAAGWMVLIAIAAVAIRDFPCPRCHYVLNSYREQWWSRRCEICGLQKGAVDDSTASGEH